jgi:hypothetical protein
MRIRSSVRFTALMLATVAGVLDESTPDFIGIPASGRFGAGRGRRNGALTHVVGIGSRARGDQVSR